MHKLALWVQAVVVPALGPVGLFFVSFLDSSFLSLPEINDILVVSSCAAHSSIAWLYIVLTTLGSVSGCSVLWWIGRRGGEPLLERRVGRPRLEKMEAIFRRWGTLALVVPALLPPPMPFKVFVLSAGVFEFPFPRFAVTLLLARGARYLVWGTLGMLYGEDALRLLRQVDKWFYRETEILVAVGVALALALLAVIARRLRRGDSGPV